MNYYLLTIVFLSVYGLVLIIGVFLLVYYWGKKSVVDKPEEALVFVKTGNHVNNPFKAKLISTGEKGQMYFYFNGKKVVFTPKRYDEIFHKNKRMIFINGQGQLVASPFSNNEVLTTEEKSDLIYELVSGHIGADGIRALKGKSSANVIIIAIVAFIIGALLTIGVIRFMDMQEKNEATQQTQEQIQEQPKTK